MLFPEQKQIAERLLAQRALLHDAFAASEVLGSGGSGRAIALGCTCAAAVAVAAGGCIWVAGKSATPVGALLRRGSFKDEHLHHAASPASADASPTSLQPITASSNLPGIEKTVHAPFVGAHHGSSHHSHHHTVNTADTHVTPTEARFTAHLEELNQHGGPHGARRNAPTPPPALSMEESTNMGMSGRLNALSSHDFGVRSNSTSITDDSKGPMNFFASPDASNNHQRL